MVKGGIGGANTRTGLLFEERVDLATLLANQPGYEVEGIHVYFHNKEVALVFKKHDFYRYIEQFGIDWRQHLSKKLLPDNCLLSLSTTRFISSKSNSSTAQAPLTKNCRPAITNGSAIKNSWLN